MTDEKRAMCGKCMQRCDTILNSFSAALTPIIDFQWNSLSSSFEHALRNLIEIDFNRLIPTSWFSSVCFFSMLANYRFNSTMKLIYYHISNRFNFHLFRLFLSFGFLLDASSTVRLEQSCVQSNRPRSIY